MRYDMWLHDPNTKVTQEIAENFALTISKFQDLFIRDEQYKKCLNKISPFIMMPWAVPANNF